MDIIKDYSIQNILESLKKTLQSYLEAQYHIKDTSLIEERRLLLEAPGTIYQLPYIESTPIYQSEKGYEKLRIPEAAKQLLIQLSELSPGVGIYPEPYTHQSKSIETFLGKNADLIIATGTGSGKTESFLMPILGAIAIESAERPLSARLDGCRALLLYPMNALVNDQLARIRRLFGDERVADLLKRGRGRPVRFGMYTSRTPYPGPRSPERDESDIRPLFEDFYLKYVDQSNKVTQLKQVGKWPSKDIQGFYAADKAEQRVYASGKRKGQLYTNWNWRKRLLTQENDCELLTRHEIQAHCPDLLITNYSMLEYMLMRPIERPIFQQTKEWLDADTRNEFILVLDEAHIYRGTGGAEVALLIRRLQARLGIPRERMRCMLTSASLGRGPEAEHAIHQFAHDLTGLSSISPRKFCLITGEREIRSGARPGRQQEAMALSALELKRFQNFALRPDEAVDTVKQLAVALDWAPFDGSSNGLPAYLYDKLEGFGPAEELIQRVSGEAIEFSELSRRLFPSVDEAHQLQATAVLLALCTFAHRQSDQRVLAPARLHLFFRGLPALYACISKSCSARLDTSQSTHSYLLGRLYTIPITHCSCEQRGRVFELLTHRDCGTAFIRGYMRGQHGEFLWHEPSGNVGREETQPLLEVHLLVEGEPDPDLADKAAMIWIDVATGRIWRDRPADAEGFLRAYIPTSEPELIGGHLQLTFAECPVCTRGWRSDRSKIMDLTTKGEAPFANLVKTQAIMQSPRQPESQLFPNGGRKVLLFSDGRQKAARLARDIPREVELDSFRQAISLAAKRLTDLQREVKITRDLYVAFVAVASDFHLLLFDGADQRELRAHIRQYRNFYDSQLAVALEDNWELPPPSRYHEALLRQLCHPFYSLQASTIGYVTPSKMALRRLQATMTAALPRFTPEDTQNAVIAWVSDLLREYAFDKHIADSQRKVAAGYYRSLWGSKGEFHRGVRKVLQTCFAASRTDIAQVEDTLRNLLCQEEHNVYFLNPSQLTLTVDLSFSWWQCQTCTFISPIVLAARCINCGREHVQLLDPKTSDYIRARKGFWRNPVEESLSGRDRPRHITAEEHTAQLSQRDGGIVYATTEKYELRFQDVVISEEDDPVDVLSCTTTMEVGVDIGSLVAVGLRNVPPQRENYQQRAGRAGRRSSSVSSVITYAQGGHHDSYYFHHPQEIVAGAPRLPVVNVNNPKIARRHVHAFLLQTFFHEAIDRGVAGRDANSAVLSKALGTTHDFFSETPGSQVHFKAFNAWVIERVLAADGDLLGKIVEWLPESLPVDKKAWVRETSNTLLEHLSKAAAAFGKNQHEGTEDSDELLPFLFDKGILPSYAFPTDLCSFQVEEIVQKNGRRQVRVKERPQQSIAKALSEYAPGRLIVIDKITYRSGGIIASGMSPSAIDRAVSLFAGQPKLYIYCTRCSYVQDTATERAPLAECPVCRGGLQVAEMLVPEVFCPESSGPIDETDRDQEFTYATSAQFPVPVGEEHLGHWHDLGVNGHYVHASDRRLVIVNKGKEREDDNTGFEVCGKCGAAAPAGSEFVPHPRHRRPYLIDWRSVNQQPAECTGNLRTVFLGTTFTSDLLLLRSILRHPLGINMQSSVAREALEDGLRTLSEALLLSASRFLDIDPSEFSSGFRIVPADIEEQLDTDVYLFDTLAGGAGYADQAGHHIHAILETTLALLEHCPGVCTHSCQECLRHYANQYWHDRLDRHLASHLLRYTLYGTIPNTEDLIDQQQRLHSLQRMLELDGYSCTSGTQVGTFSIPLLVETSKYRLAIGTYNGLLNKFSEIFKHPLLEALKNNVHNMKVEIVNDYLLDRNLPDVYQIMKKVLE